MITIKKNEKFLKRVHRHKN